MHLHCVASESDRISCESFATKGIFVGYGQTGDWLSWARDCAKESFLPLPWAVNLQALSQILDADRHRERNRGPPCWRAPRSQYQYIGIRLERHKIGWIH